MHPSSVVGGPRRRPACRAAISLNHASAAADTDYVARSHSHITGAGSRTPPPPGAGGVLLALAMLGASFLLVAPIVLWARFGDGSVPRTIAVAIAAALLCHAALGHVRRPRHPVVVCAPPAPAPAARAAACRESVRRTPLTSRPAPRMRGGIAARTSPSRPARPSRPSRDVRCRATARRTARRRTRP
jgi:hypothetical protein